MYDNHGFDSWAPEYDADVSRSDREGEFPFAGYQAVLDKIVDAVLAAGGKRVLDIGFGTGKLACALYETGVEIWGQDYSDQMRRLAGERMPHAHLFGGNFAQGLAQPLLEQRYDAIVSTYALHHLSHEDKLTFLRSLLPLLKDGGAIYVGDISFETAEQMELCRSGAEDWDEEESYFTYEEMKEQFPASDYVPVSYCGGVLIIR